MTFFLFDAFSLIVIPIAVLEGVRLARNEVLVGRSQRRAFFFGGLETLLLLAIAATSSPLVYVALGIARALVGLWRDGRLWIRSVGKLSVVMLALGTLAGVGVDSFDQLALRAADIAPAWRIWILVLLSTACVIAILPVAISEEARSTLAAPFVLIAFARVGVPLGAAEPVSAFAAPIVGAILSVTCALWLLSAGMRANHFEHSTLVSEIVLCERGVLLSLVWVGLASGERLAGVGAFLEWWTAAFALLTLEASLRVRPLPKAMAFFALATAVGLPGTIGFVAEDLLAHGLLETRPWLAASFVCVAAINATALYLALANLIVEIGPQKESRPTIVMLLPALISLMIGITPHFFVVSATQARAAVAPFEHDLLPR